MKAIIVDIDGCLANVEHRVKYVRQKPKNHDKLNDLMIDDKPNEWCKVLIEVMKMNNLLDLKIQTLLDETLQRKGFKRLSPLESKETVLSSALNLSKPIRPPARPLLATNITNAYVELMIHRKKKREYGVEPSKMSYDPVEIEPISIAEDKEKLLQKIKIFKKSSIELPKLLKERTWGEVIKILNILLHLAHEGTVKLHQEDFPVGRIIITYRGEVN